VDDTYREAKLNRHQASRELYRTIFDVYVNESNKVLGTTGLYRYKKDADEAIWVACWRLSLW